MELIRSLVDEGWPSWVTLQRPWYAWLRLTEQGGRTAREIQSNAQSQEETYQTTWREFFPSRDAVVARWHEWSLRATDVGIQTRSVLTAAAQAGGITAVRFRDAAARLHERTGRTAGNGSLMRTAPVALAYLDDEDAMVKAARALSDLTHVDPDAGDACVLWCCAIRHAVLTGQLDVRIGLRHIDWSRRKVWQERLDAAEAGRPSPFAHNGSVVAALQAAWSAISTTAVPVDDPARPGCSAPTI
ncbi:ADP-ribosylglycohydrolase family protein [Mycolicibacterium pyrenivorans]|uniref:ADP-ribosylglycohydrolase family protein n=1 Tax=Mycolicibacterium pyrenivorans TaxID=187102 RepID=UPI0027E37199|nr:ADP-ribosylglycohydrolase family protein [Mycolicibacterium pyrenivorans]